MPVNAKRTRWYCVECLTCGLVEVQLDEQSAAAMAQDHASEDYSVQAGEKPQSDPALQERHTCRARRMVEADWAEDDARNAKSLGVSVEVIKRWRHDGEAGYQ